MPFIINATYYMLHATVCTTTVKYLTELKSAIAYKMLS